MTDTPFGVVASLERHGASYWSPPMVANPNPKPLVVQVFSATATSPILVNGGWLNQLPAGASITISGAQGLSGLNGTWTPQPASGGAILPGSVGLGAYVANSASFVFPTPPPPPQYSLPAGVKGTRPPTTTPQPTAEAARAALNLAYSNSGDIAYNLAAISFSTTLLGAYQQAKASGR